VVRERGEIACIEFAGVLRGKHEVGESNTAGLSDGAWSSARRTLVSWTGLWLTVGPGDRGADGRPVARLV
jgi:hypothetical protein